MSRIVDQVESRRIELEENISKLQKSLRHWQTWQAEYDALREEVNQLPEHVDEKHIKQLAHDFESEVISQEEIEQLAGFHQNIQRSGAKIASLISRRIEYVQRNFSSVEKKLENVEAELDELHSVEPNTQPNTETPTTDIIERLDDSDNVISSRLCKPGEHAHEIANILTSAGISDSDEQQTGQHQPRDAQQDATGTNNLSEKGEDAAQVPALSTTVKAADVSTRSPRKKSVTFAEDTKEPAEEIPRRSGKAKNNPKHYRRDLTKKSDLAKGAFGTDDEVWELDENDRPIDFHSPYIPSDESPEDAALRRQMLHYNMAEVGAVVAQLELEDDTDESYFSEEEEEEEEEEDETILGSSTDEEEAYSDEEDKHGRATRRMVTDKYRKEMLRLEKKLSAQAMENIGPAKDNEDVGDAARESQKEQLTDSEEALDTEKQVNLRDMNTKSVRFVDDQNTSGADEQASVNNRKRNETNEKPVKEVIVERPRHSVSESRFPTVPDLSNPEDAGNLPVQSGHGQEAGDTLSSTIVERCPKPMSQTADPSKKISRFKAGRIQGGR